MTTARAVPKTTGMAEAGKAQGRAAISHSFKAVLSIVREGVSGMSGCISQARESGKRTPAAHVPSRSHRRRQGLLDPFADAKPRLSRRG